MVLTKFGPKFKELQKRYEETHKEVPKKRVKKS